MAEFVIDMDRVVREVLEALGANPTQSTQSKGDLVVSERLVTLAHLDGQWDGIQRLVVSPQAIVTPAVRDELLRRNVTLTFATAGPSVPSHSLRLAVVATGTKFELAKLIAVMKKSPIHIVPHSLDCIIASCDLLSQQVSQPKTLGLLLTRYTSAGLCLANRLHGVRAVSSHDAATVRRAAKMVGANLLIADPEAASLFALRQLVSEFCHDGVRPCPQVFQQRLG